jgi:hypothetical protein
MLGNKQTTGLTKEIKMKVTRVEKCVCGREATTISNYSLNSEFLCRFCGRENEGLIIDEEPDWRPESEPESERDWRPSLIPGSCYPPGY